MIKTTKKPTNLWFFSFVNFCQCFHWHLKKSKTARYALFFEESESAFKKSKKRHRKIEFHGHMETHPNKGSYCLKWLKFCLLHFFTSTSTLGCRSTYSQDSSILPTVFHTSAPLYVHVHPDSPENRELRILYTVQKWWIYKMWSHQNLLPPPTTWMVYIIAAYEKAFYTG